MMMSSDRAILPLRMLFVMIVASTLAIGIFVWQMMGALQELDEVGQMHQKMTSLSNGALYQHESMTAAAQMLAMNNRPEWKVQYDTARAQLKTTFADIGRLLPGPLLEVNEDIDASSDRLAEIEQASFLLAGAGYPMEGLDLLGGPEYVRLKGHFRQELVALGENLETQSKKQEEDLREELLWRGVVLGGIMAGLVAMWLVCLRLLVRWQKGMLTAQRGREQAEAQLVRQEHVLDRIIDNLPVGLFAKNVAQGYRWDIFNRKAEELFELSGATLRGTTDFEHFPDHEARFFRQIDEKVMAEGRVMDVEEEEVTTARGTWLAHTIKVPIYDEDGQPSLLLGIIEDITVRKQQANLKLQADAAELEQKNTELEEARARAEAADSAKTQFLATMSHEIRTPLNGVIGTADLLSRTELSGRQEDYVRTVQKSAETLLYVINDILDLTKLEARQLSLERLAFDLSRTVEDVIEIHGANASKKDLDLLMRYAPGTPERVFADPGRLRQILNNLISNAIKFTQSGHVLVEVSNLPAELGPTQATLCVAVKDTGIGIAAENIGKVFERFTQAEASTTRNYGGTGLGLAICKQLVELMGGEIGIESVPGEGSTFWFTLPVELDSEPVSPLKVADLRGRTVLLVDDNRVNLSILEELMAYWGCNYVSFTDSEQVLAWLERSGIMVPDMAIVDHDMPGISGADLGQALRSHPLTAEMPMMVFSSRGRRGDTAFFEEMGFDGYLVKPSRPEEIRVMLAAMLGEPRQKGVKRGMKRGILTRHILGEREGGSGEVDAAASIGLKVMVVEDEPVNQKVVRLMLEELGCEVEVASSGAGGIAAYQEACKADTSEGTAFDIVLMDMQMPGMDGPTTTRVIRAFEADAGVVRTPIIALTANAMAEHRELCLAAGMDDYMTKPLTRSKLIEHLQRWSHHVMLPVVDESAMEGISGARVAELKEIFASSAQECLDDMVNAVAGDDRERFRQGAHRLKGAAATFGYVRLQQACSEAEGAVESANREQLVQRIRRELGNVAAV